MDQPPNEELKDRLKRIATLLSQMPAGIPAGIPLDAVEAIQLASSRIESLEV